MAILTDYNQFEVFPIHDPPLGIQAVHHRKIKPAGGLGSIPRHAVEPRFPPAPANQFSRHGIDLYRQGQVLRGIETKLMA